MGPDSSAAKRSDVGIHGCVSFSIAVGLVRHILDVGVRREKVKKVDWGRFARQVLLQTLAAGEGQINGCAFEP